MKPTLALTVAALVAACERTDAMYPDRNPPDLSGNPFIGYFKDKPNKLGTSALIVPPAPNIGARGEWVKALNATAPDEYAAPVTISIRAEYSLRQATVSGMPSVAIAITNATNAAPIVITTATPHGLITGANVTINGVGGNTAANGSWLITVLSPTTFSLNGSVGNGAYIGGGVVVASAGTAATNQEFFGQPLVARVRWGTGGAYNIIDFDVPPPSTRESIPAGFPAAAPVDDIGNGVTITLSGSAFEVQIRNDANLTFLTDPGPAGTEIVVPAVPALVLASINPPQGPGVGRLTRTIYVAGTNAPFAIGASVVAPIPAFARKVWFLRAPTSTVPLRVITRDNLAANVLQDFNVPVNVVGPFDIGPNEQAMTITNNGAVECTHLELLFEVNPQ